MGQYKLRYIWYPIYMLYSLRIIGFEQISSGQEC